MDLGVGSFVFSLGIVGALPVLKRSPLDPSFWYEVWMGGRKTVPLLILGIIRTALVKSVDYPVGDMSSRFSIPLSFDLMLTLCFALFTLCNRNTSLSTVYIGISFSRSPSYLS